MERVKAFKAAEHEGRCQEGITVMSCTIRSSNFPATNHNYEFVKERYKMDCFKKLEEH